MTTKVSDNQQQPLVSWAFITLRLTRCITLWVAYDNQNHQRGNTHKAKDNTAIITRMVKMLAPYIFADLIKQKHMIQSLKTCFGEYWKRFTALQNL